MRPTDPTAPPSVSRDALRAAAATVAAAHGLDLVVLFGSAARPDPGRAPEDLDLAVRAPAGCVDAVAVTNAFVAALGTQAVDLADLRTAPPLLQALVARDGAVLHEGAPGAFAAFRSLAVRRFWDARKFREAEREAIRDFIRAGGDAP